MILGWKPYLNWLDLFRGNTKNKMSNLNMQDLSDGFIVRYEHAKTAISKLVEFSNELPLDARVRLFEIIQETAEVFDNMRVDVTNIFAEQLQEINEYIEMLNGRERRINVNTYFYFDTVCSFLCFSSNK